MIKEIEGDLLELFKEEKFDMIAHQANCFHTFGAGIAKTIKDQFPEAYAIDLTTPYGDIRKLGTYSSCATQFGLIHNIYGQFDIGGKYIQTNYDALGVSFFKLNHIYKGLHIGLPLIGCGIAGGDWTYVRYLIDARFKDMDVTVVHFK